VSASLDRALVERTRGVFAGLAGSHRPAEKDGLGVPEILVCAFDPASDCFRVVYADGSAYDLRRDELSEVGERRVVAWSVDEFRRGVEVALEDGTITSFSAEYPRYRRDEAYRRRVDARRGPGSDDLGARVGARVRSLRVERGWSAAELARRSGIAAPNVHRLESGRHVPTTRTLLLVAEALGVAVGRIVGA